MNEHPLPPEGETWLREADANLSSLDRVQRREVIDGLRAHIRDALEWGDPIHVVLARLGAPDAVTDDAAGRATGDSGTRRQLRRYWDAARVLQIVAFALALAGILVVGLLPLSGEVTLGEDGAPIFTTYVGFAAVVFWSPYFLGTMLTAMVFALIPISIRGARLSVGVATTALLIAVTAIGLVTIGNWLLLPTVLASGAAVLLLAARSPRKATLRASATVG